MAKKRITELTTETTLKDGQYVAIDHTTDGTKKLNLGAELTDLKEELEHISGISDDVKDALLQIASKVTYVDEHGQDYYDALYDALYPPADLVSISCVYTQSGTVYDTDSLDSLKADLVVTALYDDQTTETVTSYTLSGTLTAGTSTITVSYGGKTTTFTVTVTAEPVNPFDDVHWNDGVRVLGKDEYTGHTNYTTTDYVDISAINSITVTNTMTGNMQYAINWYSSNVNSSYISNKTGYLNNTSATSNKPENAQYARICATQLGGGYPYATGAIEITVG